MKPLVSLLLLWLPLSAATSPLPPASERHDHIEVGLIADHSVVAPGQRLRLGLFLRHDPGWHTYWINPGDSGLPTRLRWSLPEGWSVGPIRWPWPSRYDIAHLVNHGYGDELLLPVDLEVAEDAAPGSTAQLQLSASWLVCEVECIPGDARLSLELPVAQEPVPAADLAPWFAAAEARQPQPRPDWRAGFTVGPEGIELRAQGDFDALAGLELEGFPVQTQLAANGGHGHIELDAGRLRWTRALSDFFVEAPQQMALVLVGRRDGVDVGAWQVEAELLPGWPQAARAADPAPGSAWGLIQAIVLAAIGGVLLNLMPCVFPVLSFKALAFVEAGADGRRARRHGLLYSAGVMVSFAIIAAVLLVLRAGGEALGWGFQLQSPLIVGLLAYLMLVLGLALSGLIQIGGGLMGLGASVSAAGGDRGAFLTGVLACIVASPCTAPLMGGALGYALTQPPLAALLVFLALGFGMALPMLALSLFPALARRLPAPGPWMETLKQLLAFPLYLTAVWLAWVYGKLTSVDAMALLLVGMTLLALALWLWPALSDELGRLRRRGRQFATLVLVLVALSLVLPGGARWLTGETTADRALRWQPWTAATYAALRAEGRPVLVNMTAAWCITCLANERVALSSERFVEALEQHGISYLKGDWTDRDAEITAYLERYGRSGVPLYVLYPAGPGPGRVLPQLLTPQLVLEALASVQAQAP